MLLVSLFFGVAMCNHPWSGALPLPGVHKVWGSRGGAEIKITGDVLFYGCRGSALSKCIRVAEVLSVWVQNATEFTGLG